MAICNDDTKLESNIVLFVLHNAQAPVHGFIRVRKRCSLTFFLSHSIAAAGDSAMLATKLMMISRHGDYKMLGATIDDFPPRRL